MKKVTICDVSKETKLSPTTISRVIHNNGYVSKANKVIVEQAVDKLGYVPNKVAQGLRNQRTNFIGHVMFLSSENPIAARIADALLTASEKAGYHVLTAFRRDDTVNERELVKDLVGQMTEAIVFNTTLFNDDIARWVVSQGIQVIIIDRPYEIEGTDAIFLSNFEGARLATRHLIDNGHKKIAFIGNNLEMGPREVQRYQGFCTTIDDAGLTMQEHWVKLMPNYTIDYGYYAMEDILKNENRPTGVFVTSDLYACGVLQCAYSHGLNIPGDLSIVGYDDTLARSCAPPLSSIDLHAEMIGQTVIDMILERQAGKTSLSRHIPTSLIERRSVKNIT